MSAALSPAEAQADAAAAAGRLAEARRLLEAAAAETPERAQVWLKLAAMCRASGDLGAGLAAVSRALALDPLDFSALLSKAAMLERMGRSGEAGQAYGHALAQRPPADRTPPALASAIVHAEAAYRRHQEQSVALLRAAVPDDAALGDDERRRVDRFCTNFARLTKAYAQEPSHFHYPGLPPIEFHERAHFPWLEALEAGTADVKAELEALLASEAAELVPYVQYPDDVPVAQWRGLNWSRDWTAIHLLQNGRRVERNARHCPRTLALLAAVPQPDVPGRCPNAMFSLLAPRTRIPPHTGVANTRLVCHLPLIVPPGCGFRVGAETRAWVPGEAFVFDDTLEHEAWNDSTSLRVVLIFDLWPWALSPAERTAVAAVMAQSDAPTAESL
ncbi:MAG: aspartyl/asparaginyl beta-hydroxylase domain-containing protein [Alphaproteobacteria bacterium]|nr:aspartyl/asparaginyl beta-hydroxylase domain-containing protein [Alphaproteobacteria bacterium]